MNVFQKTWSSILWSKWRASVLNVCIWILDHWAILANFNKILETLALKCSTQSSVCHRSTVTLFGSGKGPDPAPCCCESCHQLNLHIWGNRALAAGVCGGHPWCGYVSTAAAESSLLGCDLKNLMRTTAIVSLCALIKKYIYLWVAFKVKWEPAGVKTKCTSVEPFYFKTVCWYWNIY